MDMKKVLRKEVRQALSRVSKEKLLHDSNLVSLFHLCRCAVDLMD